MTRIQRSTAETRIEVVVGDEAREMSIATSVPFLDHMLSALARYTAIDIGIAAEGDLRHHVVEDVAICVGRAVAEFAPVHRARFGECTMPMDDALVQCAIDLGGRPYYAGRLPSPLYDHWMRSFAMSAGATVHFRVIRGRDRHHVIEAAFKALGVALHQALVPAADLMSTKGVLDGVRR